MLRPSGNPRLWLAAFALWFVILWLLSSGNPRIPGSAEVPFADKILHFGYFFVGGGLLSGFLFGRNPHIPSWRRLVVLTAIALAVIGCLDEYHQTFTPGRSGNDVFDWLADILGALSGALVFKRFHHLLKRPA